MYAFKLAYHQCSLICSSGKAAIILPAKILYYKLELSGP